jgi:hypothetical protein
MSKREELMKEVLSFVERNYLASVYGGCGLSEDKKYRYILISKPRVLDGEIRIYGEKFLLLKYTARYGSLPRNDRRVFTSAEDLLKYLQLAFVDYKFQEALAIPTK